MPAYNELAEPKVVMEKRGMAAKHNLCEFTPLRTSRIDTSVGSHEVISFEKRLTVGQEFVMWPRHSRYKFATNIFVCLADVTSNCGQATHPSVFEERKLTREKGKQANFVITQ